MMLSLIHISLTAVSPSRLHFGQLRLVVFSQETAASAGFPQLVAEISNIPSMRLSAMALLTEDSVSQLLETLTPQTGVRLSKYLDTLLRTRVELGYLPGSTLSDMRRMGQRQSPALGRMALKKEGLPQDGLNAPAEALSAGSEGEVIFGGCGLIGQDGLLHDTLSLRETQLLTLLLGRSRDLPLTWEEAAFTLHVKELSVNWTKGRVTAKVVGRALMTRGAPAQAEALLEEDLRAVLQRLNAASCDALGLRRQEMFTHPLSIDVYKRQPLPQSTCGRGHALWTFLFPGNYSAASSRAYCTACFSAPEVTVAPATASTASRSSWPAISALM